VSVAACTHHACLLPGWQPGTGCTPRGGPSRRRRARLATRRPWAGAPAAASWRWLPAARRRQLGA
jgi:hypothetical protein